MKFNLIRFLVGSFAIVSLALCVLFPVLAFLGRIPEDASKFGFFTASAAWFVFATVRITTRTKPPRK